MPATNLDPLHMLKELAMSMSAVGDPTTLFAGLAEEFRKEKAASSLTPLEIPPQTLTETTTLQPQQKALPPPTEIPKSLPPTQPVETISLPTSQIKLYPINPQEDEMEGGESKVGGAEDSDNRGTAEESEEAEEGETEESTEREKREDSGDTWEAEKEETEKEEAEGSDESQSLRLTQIWRNTPQRSMRFLNRVQRRMLL